MSDGEKCQPVDSPTEMRTLESIRKRPGMYIGDTGPKGLNHLLIEFVRHACCEFEWGVESGVSIQLGADGVYRIEGPGAWFPTETRRIDGAMCSDLEMLCYARQLPDPRTSKRPYFLANNQGWFGLACACALGARLEVELAHHGRWWRQEFGIGRTWTTLTDVRPADHDATRVHWLPDTEIFRNATADVEHLAETLDGIAMMLPGFLITLGDHRQQPAVVQRFHHPDGVATLVNRRRDARGVFPNPIDGASPTSNTIALRGIGDQLEYCAALSWAGNACTQLQTFANLYRTRGGAHERGLRSGVTQALNATFDCDARMLSEAECMRGLTGVLSIFSEHAHFTNGMYVVSPDLEDLVSQALARQLADYLRADPERRGSLLPLLQCSRW